MRSFRDLETWKEAMDLVEACYRETGTFPRTEMYGLTTQLRRAAVSIPANVAEGAARRSPRAFAHHVAIALGSQAELETCLEIASRLCLVSPVSRDRLLAHAATVGRLLSGLHRSLSAAADES